MIVHLYNVPRSPFAHFFGADYSSLHQTKAVPHMNIIIYENRRKFRSQTSDNMDRWKAELGRGREKRRVEERRSEKRKSQKKEDADARKGRKVAKHCVFPMICGPGGSKSRLAKAAGARSCGAKHISKSKCTKHLVLGTFGSWDVEKVHAVVARSKFRSQNVQNTSASEHF